MRLTVDRPIVQESILVGVSGLLIVSVLACGVGPEPQRSDRSSTSAAQMRTGGLVRLAEEVFDLPVEERGIGTCVTQQLSIARLEPTSGFEVADHWIAASDGVIPGIALDLSGGPTRFRIRHKAIPHKKAWPELELLLDGRSIGRVILDGNAADVAAPEQLMTEQYRWYEAVLETDVDPGGHELSIRYTCAGFDPLERLVTRSILFDSLIVEERPSSQQACGETVADVPRKVLLVGIDGAAWSVILPMINDGRLPALESLMETGAYGELASESPTYSPAIWNSIYTGQPRSVHGIDQMTWKPADGMRSEVHSTGNLRSATLWQVASLYGRTCGVFGMHTTWPAQSVEGLIISDRSIAETVPGGVFPPDQEAMSSGSGVD